MTSPAHADPNGGFVKNEPVVAAHIALWLVANLGVILVSRYHVVTDAQWKVITVELSPIITAAVLAVTAWLIRRVVSPAWRAAETEAKRFGLNLPDPFETSPADTATDPAPELPQPGDAVYVADGTTPVEPVDAPADAAPAAVPAP